MEYSLIADTVVLSSLECPQGLWGEECAESCDCSGRGTCSAHDGSCDCDPGWTGLSCQEGTCTYIFYNLNLSLSLSLSLSLFLTE